LAVIRDLLDVARPGLFHPKSAGLTATADIRECPLLHDSNGQIAIDDLNVAAIALLVSHARRAVFRARSSRPERFLST
jgi:hypothetical protein